MPIDSKLSNIIGTKLPQWAIDQFGVRADQNSKPVRDNSNILYLANKSAWVRLVSSININEEDLRYFSTRVQGVNNSEDLAKQFVLFGGTSVYNNQSSYQLRSGMSNIKPNAANNGAYGILGTQEIQNFGYRPMPGITSVNIETQGRLGSVRQAIINFKCWDKDQLDVIDALYFKFGYSMFLEWGHTYYYPSATNPNSKINQDINKLKTTEISIVDPFAPSLTKEDIFRKIAKNSRDTEGNYDAMLGIVTNFNFIYNQEGGYDCTLRIMSLGVLGDSIKINNSSILPGILKDEVLRLRNTLEIANQPQPSEDSAESDNNQRAQNIEELLNGVNYPQRIVSYPSNTPEDFKLANVTIQTDGPYKEILAIKQQNGFIPLSDDYVNSTNVKINALEIYQIFNDAKKVFTNESVWEQEKFFLEPGFNVYSQYANQLIQNEVYPTVSENFEKSSASITQKYTSFYGLKKPNGSFYEYKIFIKRNIFAKTEIQNAKDQYYRVKASEFFDSFGPYLRSNTLIPSDIQILDYLTDVDGQTGVRFVFKFDLPITKTGLVKTGVKTTIDASEDVFEEQSIVYNLPVEFSINDTFLIESFFVNNVDQPLDFYKNQSEAELIAQNQIEQEIAAAEKLAQKELVTQITEALSYQSALEIILRTIQVRALNESFYRSGKLDVEIGRRVYKFEMWRNKYKFIDQIFSNGIYAPIINTLINDPDKIDTANYKTDNDQFAVNAKYGFASALLGSSDLQETFSALKGKEVNYKDLLNAYVVPYQIDQELIAGVKTNHPVYIPFGLLGMILNHICTLYDTKIDPSNIGGILGVQQSAISAVNNLVNAKQKPLVYIDYNPNLNFILTNPQQLSTNPWVTLIPYEGGFEDYKKLFDPEVIEDTVIKPLSGSQETTPLFNPQTSDLLSWQLPKIKDGTVYRGKLMNVLLNIDYLTGLVRDYSFKDGTNNVYLKPFLEHILSDVNKYLGNFNAIRLSYNDAANTFQFVDDQLIPSLSDEAQIEAKPPANQPIQNRTELPLVGLKSIARSLELKTEVSSKLASMLAISANSSPSNQVQSSINGDAFGFINTNYTDRYIPARTAGGDVKAAKKDGEKVASIQFNQTVSDFYSKINPSYSDVSQATNFFINKTAIQKNNDAATRSSMMIPVGINFSTDGMGGLSMGQAFTVSENLLPRNYFSPKPGNIIDGYVNQVGFALVGVSHVIEGNTWTTSFRTQMLPVKDSTVFKRAPQPLSQNNSQLGVNRTNDTATPYADKLKEDLRRLNYTVRGDELANNGDIQPELVSVANAVFKEIRNQLPNVIVEVTAGNDLFHANLVSRHRLGQALDFILLNASQEDINKTLAIIKDYSTKYQFSYIDEYDAQKQTPNATGNHFHIAVS